MNEDIYKDYILDIYNHLKNKHVDESAELVFDSINPTCGDKFKVYISLEKDTIKKISFTGNGCILSEVSLEIILNKIINMKRNDISKLSSKDIFDIVGIHPTPGRENCILSGIQSIQKHLKNFEK